MNQLILILFLGVMPFAFTQQGKELKIFVDCQFCDNSYFRQNLDHVEFVRDRKVADIHLMFVRQETGSGGSSQQIQFFGLRDYVGMNDTVSYTLDINMTPAERRDKQLRHIQLGLVRYWLKQGNTDQIDITLKKAEKSADTVIKDPWNFWVFGLNVGGWANGQETYHDVNANGTISAKRITEKNKFSLRARYSRNFQRYVYDDEIVLGNQQSSWLSVQEILSINDHWSYGFIGGAGNSIFGNYKFYGEVKAGIEYDFFPYQESTNKQVILSYMLGGRYNNYYDTTLFNRGEEFLGQQEIMLAGTVNQPWGSFSASASWFNYLHDFSLNSTSFWLRLNVRLFKGFSWRINGGLNFLRDQINLKKGDASLEEVLLQQQQLGSGYSYWVNTGINYSFGSIYNSIVNPRFDF